MSPRKKESQRVRQKQVPNQYEAEPANSAKMHTERSVKAALLQAKMEKTYTDSTQYFLEDPNKRITTNIWRIAASIVTRPATDEAVAIASKGGKSKAAVSRRKPFLIALVNSLARMLGGDDPKTVQAEIVSIAAASTRVAIAPMVKGYDADLAPSGEGVTEEVCIESEPTKLARQVAELGAKLGF